MKLGKIFVAAATSGVLLSGAFMIAEEYTGKSAFAVNMDNTRIELKTKKGTVREVLIANDIPFSADDRIEPGLDTKVKGGETTTTRKTTYRKVEDILKELNITLGSEDKVTPELSREVAEVDTIKITRNSTTTETKKEAVKFETKEEKDDTKYVDEKVTKVEGKDGEKEVTYNVVRENGKEVSKTVVSEKVLTEATAKVVVVGTKQRPANQMVKTAGGTVALANGNTAGATGAAAAQEMARRTGVPASTWEYIIARESNGQPGARNASGASGLFQTMPGWGSTATVQDQINAATRAYQAQGLSAWGM